MKTAPCHRELLNGNPKPKVSLSRLLAAESKSSNSIYNDPSGQIAAVQKLFWAQINFKNMKENHTTSFTVTRQDRKGDWDILYQGDNFSLAKSSYLSNFGYRASIVSNTEGGVKQIHKWIATL